MMMLRLLNGCSRFMMWCFVCEKLMMLIVWLWLLSFVCWLRFLLGRWGVFGVCMCMRVCFFVRRMVVSVNLVMGIVLMLVVEVIRMLCF